MAGRGKAKKAKNTTTTKAGLGSCSKTIFDGGHRVTEKNNAEAWFPNPRRASFSLEITRERVRMKLKTRL